MEQQKSKGIAMILTLFLGTFGIHKFYLGDKNKGIIYLVFFWTFIPAILSLFTFINLLFMTQHEFDVKYNGKVPESAVNNSTANPILAQPPKNAQEFLAQIKAGFSNPAILRKALRKAIFKHWI